jgi:hypothetical protein
MEERDTCNKTIMVLYRAGEQRAAPVKTHWDRMLTFCGWAKEEVWCAAGLWMGEAMTPLLASMVGGAQLDTIDMSGCHTCRNEPRPVCFCGIQELHSSCDDNGQDGGIIS